MLTQVFEMTDRQILDLASRFLEKGEHTDDGCCAPDWSADTESLLQFALTMYRRGHLEGAYQQRKRYMEEVSNDD